VLLAPLTAACLATAAHAYHLPETYLYAIMRTEGGQVGQAVRYVLGEQTQTLPAHAIVTHMSCGLEQLTFEKTSAAQRFEPRNGDSFVVRAGTRGAIAVDLDRK